MAIAFWKTPDNQPEESGDYLVTLMNGKVEVARYDKGSNRWMQDWMGHWEPVGIIGWDYMPEGMKQ